MLYHMSNDAGETCFLLLEREPMLLLDRMSRDTSFYLFVARMCFGSYVIFCFYVIFFFIFLNSFFAFACGKSLCCF